jgi:FkbM family methyltransferase
MTTPVSKPVEIVGDVLAALRRARRVSNHTGSADEAFQFLEFVVPRLPKARGQLFQDLWALWETNNKREGYFIEFGVADGVFLSNTYFLEKEMGWSGIIAEANPAFTQSIRKNRSCYVSEKCVFSRSGEQIGFLPTQCAEFSRIASIVPDDGHERRGARRASEIVVPSISLNDLLIEAKAPRDIDYMSVDTEGSELEILAAFDFDRWNIRLISVEHNRTAAREKIFSLLASHGYTRKWPELSFFDDWYVRTEQD